MDETIAPPPYQRGGPTKWLWSAEKTEQLRKLWATSLTCAQIADVLGTKKNAVAGKARRLNLPMRRPKSQGPKSPRENKPQRTQRFPQTSWTAEEIESLCAPRSACVRRDYTRGKLAKTPVKPKIEQAAPPIESYFGDPKSIVDLSFGECRFAVLAGAEGLHLFCGKPVSGLGSWCAEHRSIVFTPRPLRANVQKEAA